MLRKNIHKNIINDLKSCSNWQRDTNFLGSKYSIISNAMSYISQYNLVSAINNTGDFGVLPDAIFLKTTLIEEINKIKPATKQPFGVKLT